MNDTDDNRLEDTWDPLDEDRRDKPLDLVRLAFRSERDPSDTHYSEKTGHRARGLSAKAGRKPREHFLRTGNPTSYDRRR